MKAREIKVKMLEDYLLSIKEYEELTQALDTRINVKRSRIEHLEYDLNEYFGINKRYNIETGKIIDIAKVAF